MPLPPAPLLRLQQRFDYRFWPTHDMMEILSVWYGSKKERYPKTWQYRTLISVHRVQYTQVAVRYGYGKDWKHEIKQSLQRYVADGRLPFIALKIASEKIREAEMRAWVEKSITKIRNRKM